MIETRRASQALSFDRLRAAEYARLDELGQVYLDYTGAGLYPSSLVEQHIELLRSNVYGNPHSNNPTSRASTELVDETRAAVLDYFNASPFEYDVIFTLNASGALKLVGESFPFCHDVPFLLTYDNHNSVNGIREFARGRSAPFSYVPITDPDLRIDDPALDLLLSAKPRESAGLFAFPAQSNFSGVRHDLSWIDRAQRCGWHVLLDAAAFVPCNRLDLTEHRPDFVALSFYKMFGYPTGVGCLLVRKKCETGLVRPWFAGGTVLLARADVTPCAQAQGFALQPGGAAFEDGTVSFLSIPAVKLGLEFQSAIGVEAIHAHVEELTEFLLGELGELNHENGASLVHVYGPESNEGRGGTVALNLFDPEGRLIHPRIVEADAFRRNISVRTGCHCNPGAGSTALHVTGEKYDTMFRAREEMSLERFRLVASDVREGAVRVSLGVASNRNDVTAFVQMARSFLDTPAPQTA